MKNERMAEPRQGDSVKPPRNPMMQMVQGGAGGGKIEGPGTPVSDSIPAEVGDTGQPIKVSTKERIVSAAQDAFLEKLAFDLGFPSLDAMLESGTGQPVGPTLKDGTPAAAFGGTGEELKNIISSEIGNQPRPAAPPMNQSMANVVNGSRAPVEAPVAAPAPATAPVAAQTPGVTRSGNSFSDAAMNFQIGQNRPAAPPMNPSMANVVTGSRVPQPEQAPAATPGVVRSGNSFSQAMPAPVVNPLTQATRDYSMPEGTPVPFKPRVEAETPAAPQQAPVFQGGDASMKAADPKGYAAVAGQQPGAQERTFGGEAGAATSTPAAPTPAAVTNPLNTVVGTSTNPMPTTGAGRGVINPLAQKQNSFTEVGNASTPIAGPVDSHGNSMAATNEMKAKLTELTSTAPANAVLLGNSGLAETQALMDKWGREDGTAAATQAAIANPKSAQAIASISGSSQQAEATRNGQGIAQKTAQAANETQQRGQTLNALSASEGHSVTARGQDVAAQTHAAQLAGNPLNNELTRTQTASLQSGLDDKKRSAAIVQEMQDPKTTPERRKVLAQTVLASQGKTLNENRYLPHNTKTYNEMGQVTGETAVMFDKETGQYVTPEGAPAKVQPLPAKADLKAGQVYPTKNGPATWNGKEFVPVKK